MSKHFGDCRDKNVIVIEKLNLETEIPRTCTPQVKCGVAGLYDGVEVVLGPDSGLLEPGPDQQFINQKMRPGSGVLSVQVLPDGPTRVLQVR